MTAEERAEAALTRARFRSDRHPALVREVASAIRVAEDEAVVGVCQRWTAQIEHMKGVLAIADRWERDAAALAEAAEIAEGFSVGSSGPIRAAMATSAACAKDLLDEWDRLAFEPVFGEPIPPDRAALRDEESETPGSKR